MKMNLICMNMNMLVEHISHTHVWFRTKTRFDTGNRQLGVGLSLCSHCSFLLVQPTTKKIIISLHSRFSGEHDIGVYFTLISPLLSWLHNCDDQSCLYIFLHSSNIWYFIYSRKFFTICGYITGLQSYQLPVGLIVQLVEHCTGIAEVLVSNPIQAGISFWL